MFPDGYKVLSALEVEEAVRDGEIEIVDLGEALEPMAFIRYRDVELPLRLSTLVGKHAGDLPTEGAAAFGGDLKQWALGYNKAGARVDADGFWLIVLDEPGRAA